MWILKREIYKVKEELGIIFFFTFILFKKYIFLLNFTVILWTGNYVINKKVTVVWLQVFLKCNII